MPLTERQAGLHAQLQPARISEFIVVQMDQLIGSDTVLYVDSKVEVKDVKTDRDSMEQRMCGQLIAFTGHRVILLTMTDTPVLPKASDSAGRTVKAKTWSRRRLRSISLQGTDQSWAGDEQSPEPYIRLNYKGRAAVEIPLAGLDAANLLPDLEPWLRRL